MGGIYCGVKKSTSSPAYEIQPLFEDPNSAIRYRREVAARDLETIIKRALAESGLRVRDPLTRSLVKASANDSIVLLQDFKDFCQERGIEVRVRTAAQQRLFNPEPDERPVREIAVEMANELDLRDRHLGAKDSLKSMSERVAKGLNEKGIKNAGGGPFTWTTVKREFLQGDRWFRRRPNSG